MKKIITEGMLVKVKHLPEYTLEEKVEIINELLEMSHYVRFTKDGEEVAVHFHTRGKNGIREIIIWGFLDWRIYDDIEEGKKDFCKTLHFVNVLDLSFKFSKPLAILNTSILTSEGAYEICDISLEDAKEFVIMNEGNLLSAIGHQSTADVLSRLLDVKIEKNRINFEQEEGQKAIVFKLNGRIEEGQILTVEDIERIGYKFQFLEKVSD